MGAHSRRASLRGRGPKVRFVHSRNEFRRVASHLGLIFSEFSTSSRHVQESAAKLGPDSSMVEKVGGLSFFHERSGLPFDFGLQLGLLSPQAAEGDGAGSRRLAAGESPAALPCTLGQRVDAVLVDCDRKPFAFAIFNLIISLFFSFRFFQW